MDRVGAAVLLFLAVPIGATDSAPDGFALFRDGDYAQAEAALTAALDATVAGIDPGHALFVIATIQRADGRTAQASATLRRLLDRYATSPWALHAGEELAALAAADGRWNEAIDTTAQMLDMYLEQPVASVDDKVCRAAFDRLVAAARQLDQTGTEMGALRFLQERFPLDGGPGRVVAFFTELEATDPKANRVRNPGFELDGRECGTPVAWQYLGTEPDLEDDLDGVLDTGARTGIVLPHSGRFCAGKYTEYGVHRGWLVQTVRVTPRTRYAVSAYGATPCQEPGHGGVLRIGVDPNGGSDPTAGGVVWSATAAPEASYERIALEGASAVLAEGERLTVFLEFRQPSAHPRNALLFDDVSVQSVP